MLKTLFPRPHILISSVIYGGTLMAYYAYYAFCGCTPMTETALPFSIGILMLFALDRVEFYFWKEHLPSLYAVLFFAARVLLFEFIGQYIELVYMAFLYAFLPFVALMQFGNFIGYSTAILVWWVFMTKLFVIYPWWVENIFYIDAVLTFHIMLIFTLIMAHIVHREQVSRIQAEQLFAQLEKTHEQLQHYTEQAEGLAVAQERTRLARDIHDTLGHYLTAISIQMEKALVFHQTKPDESYQALKQSKQLADEALKEVRHSVRNLRESGQRFSLSEALNRMVSHMESQKIQIRLQIEGNEAVLSESAMMALYRAAQEGLTNIQKHALAKTAELYLSFGEDESTLIIRDDGCGFDLTTFETHQQGRYGLRGLRERLHLIGGRLTIQSIPGIMTALQVAVPNK